MAICFWRIRENPVFAALMACNRGDWPRCLAWHGWFPMLSPRRTDPPWAVAMADSVYASLEVALCAYPLDTGSSWNPGFEDIADTTGAVPGKLGVWTDGSRDEDLDALVAIAGAGASS